MPLVRPYVNPDDDEYSHLDADHLRGLHDQRRDLEPVSAPILWIVALVGAAALALLYAWSLWRAS